MKQKKWHKCVAVSFILHENKLNVYCTEWHMQYRCCCLNSTQMVITRYYFWTLIKFIDAQNAFFCNVKLKSNGFLRLLTPCPSEQFNNCECFFDELCTVNFPTGLPSIRACNRNPLIVSPDSKLKVGDNGKIHLFCSEFKEQQR